MSALVVVCRRCGKEAESEAADKTGLCALCVVSDAIAPFKAEYARLWSKRLRYSARAGISLANVEEQLARVARRLGDQVHARIVNPNVAIPLINQHLAEVREQVERPNARIRIAQPGDMTRRLVTA